MNRQEALARGRAEAAAQHVAEAERDERLAVRRAAELTRPRLTHGPRTGGYWSTVEHGGNTRAALTLSPVPVQGPPEVLVTSWYDGLTTHPAEPVARLVLQDRAGATYALADTRAGRDFSALLDCLGDAWLEVPTMVDGRPARTAAVIWG